MVLDADDRADDAVRRHRRGRSRRRVLVHHAPRAALTRAVRSRSRAPARRGCASPAPARRTHPGGARPPGRRAAGRRSSGRGSPHPGRATSSVTSALASVRPRSRPGGGRQSPATGVPRCVAVLDLDDHVAVGLVRPERPGGLEVDEADPGAVPRLDVAGAARAADPAEQRVVGADVLQLGRAHQVEVDDAAGQGQPGGGTAGEGADHDGARRTGALPLVLATQAGEADVLPVAAGEDDAATFLVAELLRGLEGEEREEVRECRRWCRGSRPRGRAGRRASARPRRGRTWSELGRDAGDLVLEVRRGERRARGRGRPDGSSAAMP